MTRVKNLFGQSSWPANCAATFSTLTACISNNGDLVLLLVCSFEYSGSADQLKQFDTYMVALNSWCSEQQMSSVQQVPVYGQSVCVRHTDTGQWRRAQVTRLSDRYVESPVPCLWHSMLLSGIWYSLLYFNIVNDQQSGFQLSIWKPK